MYPVTRTLTAASLGLSLVALAACGDDRSVNPVAEQVEGAAGAITTASTITAEYDLYPGQSVKINPKSTSRTNRLKWTTTNSGVATVNSQGTVSAKVVGNAVVTVSGSGVLESYAVVVQQPTLTLTSFSLQPQASVTLTAGQTQQFSTSQTWSDGVARTSGVTYTATGGTISSTGLYTAGSLAGAFMVVASCSCTTPAIADTTFVTVQAAAQLTKLTVSPKTVSLNAGASQQFAVTANWSTGATTVPPVTWTASGGTVSGTGAYVAPSTAGTYRVIVAHTGGTVRDTAVVTVAQEPPPPGPLAEPLYSDGFESGVFGTANGFSWQSRTRVTISNEKAYTGANALRFEFPGSAIGSDAWSELRFDLGRYTSQIWIEYMLYVPANFRHRDDRPGNNKLIVLWKDTYGSLSGEWAIAWEYERLNDTASTGRFMSSRWDEPYVTSGGAWPTPAPPNFKPLIGGTGPIKIGQWNRVRFMAKAASSRTAEDGESRLWINDSLVFEYTRGRFHNSDPLKGDAALRRGYLMGWANSGFNELTLFYIDDTKFFVSDPGWK